MTAIDRMTEGYEPRFDIDSEVGRQGELWITNIADALRSGSAETKTDAKALRTGNVYIEFECRGKPSGIRHPDLRAELWCQVIAVNGLAIVVATDVLSRVVERHLTKRNQPTVKACKRGSHPTRAVALPLGAFVAEIAYELKQVSA